MIDPLEVMRIISAFVGGGLAGSIFTKLINKRRGKHILRLDTWFFPHPENKNLIQCFLRTTMLFSPVTINNIEFCARQVFRYLNHWPCREGLKCELVTDTPVFRVTNMRENDFIDFCFIMNQEEISSKTDFSKMDVIDYSCTYKIVQRKYNSNALL